MIRLGPAGSPMKTTLDSLSYIKEIKLNAMEVEFTYGVRMKNELAKEIGKLAEKLDISQRKVNERVSFIRKYKSGESDIPDSLQYFDINLTLREA